MYLSSYHYLHRYLCYYMSLRVMLILTGDMRAWSVSDGVSRKVQKLMGLTGYRNFAWSLSTNSRYLWKLL